MQKISLIALTLTLSVSVSYAQYSGQRVNLGSNINSEGNTDSAPVITYDGSTMFFKRSVSGASYDYDIYYSKLDNNKQWSKALPVPELNNDKVSEVEYVYPDGKTMIVCGTFNNVSGLFYAFNKNGKWTNLKHIDIGKKVDANEDNLNVTLNSKQDLMVVSIQGDLYLSKLRNGEWEHVKEITELNTSGYEYTPFIDYDDKTLYIAGTGYSGNSGEADIWKVTRTDDSWMHWSTPEKVSGNINTEGWDSFFYIPPSKDYVYVYNLNEGDGDILRIKTEVKTEDLPETVAVTALVNEEDQQLIQEAIETDVVVETEGEQLNETERLTTGNLQELEEILVYPNPTRGQFTIALNNSNESTFSQISILDQNLRVVTTIGTSQNTYNFDLSEYANGIYFVRVQCNGKTEIKKVILDK